MEQSNADDQRTFYVRALATILMAMGVVIAALTCWYAIDALFLLLGGILLAIFLESVSQFLGRFLPLSYGWRLTIVLLVLGALLVGFVIYLAPTSSRELQQVSDRLVSTADQLQQQVDDSKWLSHLVKSAKDGGWKTLISGDGSLRFLNVTMSWTLGTLLYAIIILFLGIYLASEPMVYVHGLSALVPIRQRPRLERVLAEAKTALGWWLAGRFTAMAIIGVLSVIGLWLMGIPNPLGLGLLAGLLTFIPNLGPTLGLLPPLLLALPKGWQLALGVLAFYVALQSLEGWVITPLVQRQGAKLPPVVTLGSQVLMGTISGVLGVTIAAPLALLIMVFVRNYYVEGILGDKSYQ